MLRVKVLVIKTGVLGAFIQPPSATLNHSHMLVNIKYNYWLHWEKKKDLHFYPASVFVSAPVQKVWILQTIWFWKEAAVKVGERAVNTWRPAPKHASERLHLLRLFSLLLVYMSRSPRQQEPTGGTCSFNEAVVLQTPIVIRSKQEDSPTSMFLSCCQPLMDANIMLVLLFDMCFCHLLELFEWNLKADHRLVIRVWALQKQDKKKNRTVLIIRRLLLFEKRLLWHDVINPADPTWIFSFISCFSSLWKF